MENIYDVDKYINEEINNEKKQKPKPDSSFKKAKMIIDWNDLIWLPKDAQIENLKSFKVAHKNLYIPETTIIVDTSNDKFYKVEKTSLLKSSFINKTMIHRTQILLYSQVSPILIFAEMLMIEAYGYEDYDKDLLSKGSHWKFFTVSLN